MASAISARAKAAPMQVRGPALNARWLHTFLRSKSTIAGHPKRAGSLQPRIDMNRATPGYLNAAFFTIQLEGRQPPIEQNTR